MATEGDCIDALREAARKLGSSPTKAEYEELELTPASATIIRNVGGWNEAKERAGLATNSSTGSRVGPPPENVDDEIRERWAELSIDQRWHYRNVEWNTERTRERRGALREWVNEQKAERGCGECGESDPRCLDFHHRTDEAKEKNVSQLVNEEASRDRIGEEITKCVVLCANCHRRRHVTPLDPDIEIELRLDPPRLVGERPDGETFEVVAPDRRRVWVTSYKEQRGCTNCDYDDGAALDFHHTDAEAKEFTVSRLVSEGYGTERVYREMQRCEVRCANCHRKLHRGG